MQQKHIAKTTGSCENGKEVNGNKLVRQQCRNVKVNIRHGKSNTTDEN